MPNNHLHLQLQPKNPPAVPPEMADLIDPVPIEVRRERVRRGSRRRRDLIAVAEADAREVRERITTTGPDAEARAAWGVAHPRLAASVPPSTFELWLASLELAGAEGSTLFLVAPEGIRSWVQRRYASLIREALDGTGFSDVEFVAEGAECL